MDGPSYESTHQLLLALAGHVDDDLLGWARELLAVGEEARAVSVTTAAVVAERISLPAPVLTALIEAGRTARAGIDAAEFAPAAEPLVDHRFDATDTAEFAAALRTLPARRLQDTVVHLTHRLTPAGTAPGPLPHPVVLVEINPGRQSGEVLSYQVAAGLARVGVHASVEVVTTGQQRSGYHVAAFDSAALIVLDTDPPVPGTVVTDEPSVPAEPDAPERSATPQVADEADSAPVSPVTDTDLPLPDAVDAAGDTDADTPSDPPADTPAEATDEPATGPVRIVAAAAPVVPGPRPDLRPERHPLADAPRSPRPVVGSPALSALSDPLAGPPPAPPSGPRHDPTIQEHDPLGVDHLMRSSTRPPEPPAPPRELPPAPVIEDSWAAEWESGAWAIPFDEPEAAPPPPDRVGPPEAPVGPPPYRGRPLRAPRIDAGGGDVRDVRDVRDIREDEVGETRAEPRAEARSGSARLSNADRDLLARLQADLQDGRRTRISRKPGTASSRRQITNGHGPDHPPDIAG